MVAIIYSIFLLIILIIFCIKESINNSISQIKFMDDNKLTYTDSRGRTRLLCNNHIALYHSTHISCYGDYILEDIENGKLIKNFSLEQRIVDTEKKRQIAIQKGQTTFFVNIADKHMNFNQFYGRRFQDVNTNDIYVIRCFGNKYYYINITNGYIIRETDISLKTLQTEKGVNVTKFNKKQELKMEFYNSYYTSSCDFHY